MRLWLRVIGTREGTQYTYDLKYDGKPLYFRRLNSGNTAVITFK